MKKIFLSLIIIFCFWVFAASAHAWGADPWGDDGGSQANDSSNTSDDGFTSNGFGQGGTYTCSNSGETKTWDSNVFTGPGTEPGAEPPGPSQPPICIPDGQACPQTQEIRTMISGGKYCSPAEQLHNLCKPKNPTYSTQTTSIDCCTGSCNNGICGGSPPEQPPQEPSYVPPPACNQPCQVDLTCLSYDTGDGCTKCVKADGAASGVCKPPTPTPPPACNAECTTDVYCKAGNDGCDTCVKPAGSAKGVCKTKPPACNVACTTDVYCQGGNDGCDTCIKPAGSATGVCQAKPPTPTPTASPTPTPTITPTPTPTFNPGNCKCVPNLEYANLKTGQSTTITGKAQILGSDNLRGRITSQDFFLQEGADSNGGTIISTSGKLPATKLDGTSPTQYESKWTFTLPKLAAGKTYKIFRNISCEANTSGFTGSKVAGAATYIPAPTQQQSLLGRLASFVRGIFGVAEQTNTAAVPTSTSANIAAAPGGATIAPSKDSLQLQTINPIEVYQKTCSVIKFRYNF